MKLFFYFFHYCFTMCSRIFHLYRVGQQSEKKLGLLKAATIN